MIKIPLFKVYMNPEASSRVAEVLDSGYIGQGEQVNLLEKELLSYFSQGEINSLLTTNSATSAEHLIYHYLKKDRELKSFLLHGVASYSIKWDALTPADEVLTTALTCTATNFPIVTNDIKLKWVDVDPNTLNMDLDDLEAKIDHKTRIVTVVHWGGYPVDLDRLTNIVQDAEIKYGRSILILEDCAHAFGATYKNEYVGFTGNVSTFSLQAIKHITSIDGGFVTTPYKSMYDDFKLLRWYGIDRETPRRDFRCEEDIKEAGFKFHMNDVSAVVGRSNLEKAHKILHAYRDNAHYYDEALKDIPGLQLISPVEGASPSYWLYTVLVEDRDYLMRKLEEYGIASSKVHARNDTHTCMKEFRSNLPGVDLAEKRMLSIPVGWWVTDSDREYIVNTIKQGW